MKVRKVGVARARMHSLQGNKGPSGRQAVPAIWSHARFLCDCDLPGALSLGSTESFVALDTCHTAVSPQRICRREL